MSDKLTLKKSSTFTATIFIAGDYDDAVRACREFCEEGLCVTVEKCAYVYTGGMEDGVRIGLINYPRFPKSENDLVIKAAQLGMHLRERLYQDSFTVVSDTQTYWYTRRSQ